MSQGPDLAEKLKVLMDRAFVGSLRRLSTNPEGNPDYGTPDQQTIGNFSNARCRTFPSFSSASPIQIPERSGFSPPTRSAKSLSCMTTLKLIRSRTSLPQSLVQKRVSRNAALAMAGASSPRFRWQSASAGRWFCCWRFRAGSGSKFRNRPNLHSYSRMSMPLLVSFSALAHRIIAAYFGLPLLPRLYYCRIIGVLISIGFFWFLLRVTSLTMQRLRIRAISGGRIGTGTLMVLAERLLTALVVVVAILAILAILGFNLTTLLAGLGIGGIAIAFAAQKTLENLFGGISVLADEVIRVGDYCRFGDRTGTVEDISLRSTRVRTDARTELSIPNGTLATMSIENFTRRDKILFNPVLAIRYETTADQLRYLLAEIRRMLYEHPKVESDSASIRFANFDNSALRLEIFGYVLTARLPTNSPPSAKTFCCASWTSSSNRAAVSPFRRRLCILSRDSGLDKEKTAAAEHAGSAMARSAQASLP